MSLSAIEDNIQKCKTEIDRLNTTTFDDRDEFDNFQQRITDDIMILEESIGFIEKIVKNRAIVMNEPIFNDIMLKLSSLIDRLNITFSNLRQNNAQQITGVIGSVNDVITQFTLLRRLKQSNDLFQLLTVIVIIIGILLFICVYLVSPCIFFIILFLLIIMFCISCYMYVKVT